MDIIKILYLINKYNQILIIFKIQILKCINLINIRFKVRIFKNRFVMNFLPCFKVFIFILLEKIFCISINAIDSVKIRFLQNFFYFFQQRFHVYYFPIISQNNQLHHTILSNIWVKHPCHKFYYWCRNWEAQGKFYLNLEKIFPKLFKLFILKDNNNCSIFI